jgi:hypothetical protein
MKKYLISERSGAWVIFIEAPDIHPLCTIADAIESFAPGIVSEIRYNRNAGQGIILTAKSAALSRERLQHTIDELTL